MITVLCLCVGFLAGTLVIVVAKYEKVIGELEERIMRLAQAPPFPVTPQIMIGDKETGFKIG